VAGTHLPHGQEEYTESAGARRSASHESGHPCDGHTVFLVAASGQILMPPACVFVPECWLDLTHRRSSRFLRERLGFSALPDWIAQIGSFWFQ
jgi:hypothetical protein